MVQPDKRDASNINWFQFVGQGAGNAGTGVESSVPDRGSGTLSRMSSTR